MKVRGVLDRIEDNGMAVILLEEGSQCTIPETDLPPGSELGSWFEVTVEDGEAVSITIDRKITDAKERQVSALIGKLNRKTRGSRFKK